VRRRLALVAALVAATGLAVPTALAADGGGALAGAARAETNGCLVLPSLQLAICIPRL